MCKVELVSDFISDEDCSTVIKYLDENENTPDFPQLRYKSSFSNRKTFVDPYSQEIKEIVLKYAAKLGFGPEYYVAEYFLSLFSEGYEMHMHQDVLGEITFTHSIVMYCNEDFEGGELEVPELGFIHKPKTGDMVIFSPNTLEHSVTKIIKGKRYTLPFWLTKDKQYRSKFLYS